MSINKKVEVILSKTKTFKINLEVFNSAQEVAKLNKIRTFPTCGGWNDMQTREIRKEWHGVDSYEEAYNLLSNGWSEKVEVLKKDLRQYQTADQKRRRKINDVHGFAPIVPLAIKGVPNSMIREIRKPIKSKVVNICYDSTAPSYTDVKDFLRVGKEILRAIVELEFSGYRVNLYSMQAYNDDYSSDMMLIKIKNSTQPLDLKRVSFPLIHPAFFRVVGFDWYSKAPDAKYRSGYGKAFKHTIRNDNDIDKVAHKLLGDNTLFMEATQLTEKGTDKVKEFIINKIIKKEKKEQ